MRIPRAAPGRAVLAIAAIGLGLCAALLQPAMATGEREAGVELALPSRLASESLLLDAKRVGKRLVAVGEWGHVVLSDDTGATWRQARSVPTRMLLTALYFVDEQEGWAVGHDAVIVHTRDAGEVWEIQHLEPEAESPLLGVWFENASHGLAVGAFGLVLETRDGGLTWSRRSLTEKSDEEIHLNALFPGEDGSVFVAAERGSLFRSRDAGLSWERLALPYEGSFWGGLALGDGRLLTFGMRGHVFRSSDRGETWQPLESVTDQSLQNATRLSNGRVILVGLGGIILGSDDGGQSFTAMIQSDRKGLAAVAEGKPGEAIFFGEAGISRRTTR